MSAKNFRINKDQSWTLSNMASYTEDCEIVINGESYDPDEETFDCAIKIKEEAHDSIWLKAEPYMTPEGWVFFTMLPDGSCDFKDVEEEL